MRLKQCRFLLYGVLTASLLMAGTVFIGCASIEEVPSDTASQLYYKGLRLFNKGRYEDAKEIFHEYVGNNPGTHLYPVSMYYLGYCYQKLDEQAQARLIYHKVIDENEDDFWAQMAKARLGEMGSASKR